MRTATTPIQEGAGDPLCAALTIAIERIEGNDQRFIHIDLGHPDIAPMREMPNRLARAAGLVDADIITLSQAEQFRHWLVVDQPTSQQHDESANAVPTDHRPGGVARLAELWQNLRSTREAELAESFPLHVVCAWIGNSQPVAAKHYLQVTDEHFLRARNALQNPCSNPALTSATA